VVGRIASLPRRSAWNVSKVGRNFFGGRFGGSGTCCELTWPHGGHPLETLLFEVDLDQSSHFYEGKQYDWILTLT